MLTYATFAVGFLTRPLGGIIFGHFGDRIGRKSVLVATLMIMGVSTFAIGMIPTYDQIGFWAPALLLTMRIFQGIGLGGEWGGAVLMAYEFAPEKRRGFYTSIPQIGLSLGILLSAGTVALLSTVMSNESFMSWGWRTCFLISFVLVFVGMWIRLQLFETPEFSQVKASNDEAKLPIVEMFHKYTSNVLLGLGARHVDGVFFNVFAVFAIMLVRFRHTAPHLVFVMTAKLEYFSAQLLLQQSRNGHLRGSPPQPNPKGRAKHRGVDRTLRTSPARQLSGGHWRCAQRAIGLPRAFRTETRRKCAVRARQDRQWQ